MNSTFHDPPTVESEDSTEKLGPKPELSQLIPGFQLLQKLGAGGMGEVFEAEQREPVRRRVAIKLIKRGMESADVLARFESERQALALMSHPNIAQVFDAGTTLDGRPYFVMELVQGIPVTRYCDDNRLTTIERLELFGEICAGVQHAHHKGVIHRDLKPTNVLIKLQDGRPVPKIIDFGVAKATAQRLTEHTLFTAVGEFIGTPEYMSPEQAELTELDIDTRTDVYSLGVVLYEMLVGAQPFDPKELRRAGFGEMQRRIKEEEPPRPSMRFSGLGERSTAAAEARHCAPAALLRQLHGDLDWITMKALEKDRNRRYGSPSELAADIARHLHHEPVVASPPSTVYRLRKLIRRHTLAVTAGALVTAALVLGIAGTSIGMIEAQKAQRDAAREAETARQISDFLTGLFEVSDPTSLRGETITAREILDRGATKIRGLDDEPEVQARLMETIGRVYEGLGLYDRARALAEESLAIRESIFPANHPEVARSLEDLGKVLRRLSHYDEALPLLERSLNIIETSYGPDHPEAAAVLNALGLLEFDRGGYEQARRYLDRALAIDERTLDPGDPGRVMTLTNIAILQVKLGKLEEAKSLFERALEISEAADDDFRVANSLSSIAGVLNDSGDFQAALPLYERAIAIQERVLGPDHPIIAGNLSNLGALLRMLGEKDRATPILERSAAIYRSALGERHPGLAEPLTTLAIVHATSGRPEEARPLFEQALAIREEALGPEHASVATSLNNLGVFHRSTGNDEAARPYYERALESSTAALGPDHPDVALPLTNLANLLKDLGEYDEARALYDRALLIRETTLGPKHTDVSFTLVGLASLADHTGDAETALEYMKRALEIWEGALGEDHPRTADLVDDVGNLLHRLGHEREAEEAAARAEAIRKRLAAADQPS